ncbi:MAG: cysteine desulfurase NifS [Syntrophus sp. (in: bacteria)]|nr:cysteine desulfurase NifS [Syntrophus sp. (in: bacteria)]
MQPIYLDHISATPLHPEVRNAMVEYIQNKFGNPISQHRIGDEAMETLEGARKEVAGLIHAQPEEVIFTSGGTESINHAIKGVALAMGAKGRHIITSNIEHQSVLRSLRMLMKLGYRVTSLPVDKYGLVDPAGLEKAITDDTILVTIMHANNEIGTIEPIAEIGKITRERGILFHTDAVASIGVVPFNVEEMGVDLASMAANQFYGPSGVGALYVRPKTRIAPLLDGGIQEYNLRAGSQNMVGIVGMGKAAELAKKEMFQRMAYLLGLKSAFVEQLLTIDEIVINGHPELSIPNLISFSVKYIEGESMLLMLDEEGVYASTRSACATGSLRASHVLIAAGCDYTAAQGTLIVSFGITNTMEEVEKAFQALKKSVTFLRSMSPLYQKK